MKELELLFWIVTALMALATLHGHLKERENRAFIRYERRKLKRKRHE